MNLRLERRDRDEVDGSCLDAVDAEEIDLSSVVLRQQFRIRMVVVAASGAEGDRALLQPSGLALDEVERAAVLDREVVPGVLADRQQHAIAARSERENDRELRSVADVLRMLSHVVKIAY